MPTHVKITSTKYPSIALCEQITSVSVSRLIKHLGRVTEQELKEMEGACAVSLGTVIWSRTTDCKGGIENGTVSV